jgi:uncharacterized membrane protein
MTADRGTGRSGASAGDHPLRRLLTELEHHVLDVERGFAREATEHVAPAWRRVTDGESRWSVSLAVLVAIGLQIALPLKLSLHPHLVLPAVETMLLAALVIANPGRINRRSSILRKGSLALIAVVSVANAWSAVTLIHELVTGTEQQQAQDLLLTGACIWLTNVVVFALWYWELDRGGPVARAYADREHPDFVFPQMESPHLAPDHWEPNFVDYFYLSFTNGTAFSPTDVLPLSRWAKLMMLAQSCISLATVALVVARAVNILA